MRRLIDSVRKGVVWCVVLVPDVADWDPEGHSRELAVERGYHLAHGLGCACGGGDDVVQGAAARSERGCVKGC